MLSADQVAIFRRATDRECCSSKYAISSSFVKDGYRYWTDGKIALRTKSDEASTADFNTPEMAMLGWTDDRSDMVSFPHIPDKTFYEEYRRERWNNDEYKPATLSATGCLVGSVIIDPRYFSIIRGLGEAVYRMSDDRKSLIIVADECEAIVMGIARSPEWQNWVATSRASSADFPSDVVTA